VAYRFVLTYLSGHGRVLFPKNDFSPTPARRAICRVLVPWYRWRANSFVASIIVSAIFELLGTIGIFRGDAMYTAPATSGN